jgi:hypothetical protein
MPFHHHLGKIPIAKRISEVPTDAKNNNLIGKVSPSKQRWPISDHGFSQYQRHSSGLQHSPPKRDASAAKRFFQKALRSPNHPRPRVINVDGNPAYPRAIDELKRTQELGRRCRCRPVRYLNNVVEQDHRAIKRRVRAMQGFRSFDSAWRMIQGIETVNMIVCPA